MAKRRRRRFGRVRQLPSGRFQVRYPVPGNDDLPGPYTFRTRTEADRYLAQVETDLARGTWVDHRLGKETVEAWATRYMATVTHLKPKTRTSYQSLVASVIVPRLGKIPVGQLRPIAVREWVSELVATGLSPSRVQQAYRLLSQMMDAAETSGLIALTPCRGISLPKMPETEPVILTPAQVEALAGKIRKPYDVLVLVLGFAGLRIGEAFALRRSSIDLLNRRLIVRESLSEANGKLTFEAPKSHQQRSVSLPPFLVKRLEEHLLTKVPANAEALLFRSRNGTPMRHANFMRAYWRPAVAEAKLPSVTPHDLRASHGTWVIDQGGSVLDAAARLGHATASVTTRHYARAVKGRDDEIASRLEGEFERISRTDRARNGHDGQPPNLSVAT